MPQSRHRRKGRSRPRPQHVAGPVAKPKPSPRWVPFAGLGLLAGGALLIIVNYVVWERNALLVTGFAMLTFSFVFLTRYR